MESPQRPEDTRTPPWPTRLRCTHQHSASQATTTPTQPELQRQPHSTQPRRRPAACTEPPPQPRAVAAPQRAPLARAPPSLPTTTTRTPPTATNTHVPALSSSPSLQLPGCSPRAQPSASPPPATVLTMLGHYAHKGSVQLCHHPHSQSHLSPIIPHLNTHINLTMSLTPTKPRPYTPSQLQTLKRIHSNHPHLNKSYIYAIRPLILPKLPLPYLTY